MSLVKRGEAVVNGVQGVIAEFRRRGAVPIGVEIRDADHNAVLALAMHLIGDRRMLPQGDQVDRVCDLIMYRGAFRRSRVVGHFTSPLIDRLRIPLPDLEPAR